MWLDISDGHRRGYERRSTAALPAREEDDREHERQFDPPSADEHSDDGVRDILMLNSVVDISGLNRISRTVLSNAANAGPPPR